MATSRDKRSGMVYRARDRLMNKRSLEWDWEQAHASHSQSPLTDNRACNTLGADSPMVLADDLPNIDVSIAPSIYESEEEAAMHSGSDTAAFIDDDNCFDEGPMIDRPFGDTSFEDGLRLWALKTGQTHEALRSLLALARQHLPQYKLPRDPRTFLSTPVSKSTVTDLSTIDGGRLWYGGIERCLKQYYRYVKPSADGFSVDFFVDGLPLYNSSRTQFWPILMKVFNVPGIPVMTVAIFHGESKPHSVEQFLRPFVTELNNLQFKGLHIGNDVYWVGLRSIIADAPARAFIKGVKSHGAYEGCQKCTTVADREGSRMFFRYRECREPRTHAKFVTHEYPAHIIYRSPLVDLTNCDVVQDIVSAERMHLVDKGVMHKCLNIWINGHCEVSGKLTKQQQHEVSVHLNNLKLPSDFKRKLRNLHYVAMWKASELKMFLQYAGFVVLKGKIGEQMYQHFMLFFVAMTFLSTSHHEAKWQYAASLLEQYVRDFGVVYNPCLISSNVHNLLHVYEDVVRFGDINTISAYPFEAKLHDIKKLVRSGRNSLAQAVNRLAELEVIDVAQNTNLCDEGNVPTICNIGQDIVVKVRVGFILRQNFRDQWFMTNDGTVVKFKTATKEQNGLVIQGQIFVKQTSAFSQPCPSAEAFIFLASLKDLCHDLIHFLGSTVMSKTLAISEDDVCGAMAEESSEATAEAAMGTVIGAAMGAVDEVVILGATNGSAMGAAETLLC
uniref:Transposase domain-containing protein n=1 Tax=Anopheles epiroticus TaxID=199890 RepID=A0A182P9T4_9DIPT